MSRLTLKDRVTLASALVLAGGLALLTLGINLLLTHRLAADASAVLRERADAQLAALDVKGGRVALRDAIHNETLDRETWVHAGKRTLLRAPGGPDLQRAADALAGTARDTERNVGERFRLRAEPAFVGAGSGRRVGTVVVAVSLAPYEHTERIARYSTLLLDLFVLAAGVLLVRFAVGKALQPVADMTTRAAEWSEHDLDRRFGLGPPRDELTALSATLDGLLARLGSSLRHEQRFSAEMAHELRTPLSGVRGDAELALRARDTPQDVRASLEQILSGTERMEAVIDTLLAAARATLAAPRARRTPPEPHASPRGTRAGRPYGRRADGRHGAGAVPDRRRRRGPGGPGAAPPARQRGAPRASGSDGRHLARASRRGLLRAGRRSGHRGGGPRVAVRAGRQRRGRRRAGARAGAASCPLLRRRCLGDRERRGRPVPAATAGAGVSLCAPSRC